MLMASLIRYAASPEVTPIGSVASLLRLGGSLRRCAADATDGVVRCLALRCYWAAQLALISEPPSPLGLSLAIASIGAAIQVVMAHRLPTALTPTPPAALSAAVQSAVLAATAAGRPLPAARPPLLPPPPSASSMLRFSGSSMSAPGSSMKAAQPAPLDRQGREISGDGDAICPPHGPIRPRPPPPPPAAANPIKRAPTGSAVSGAPTDHASRSPPQRPRAAQCAEEGAVLGSHDGASSPPAASLPQRPRSAQPTINRNPLGGGAGLGPGLGGGGSGAEEGDGTSRYAPAPSPLVRPSRPPSAPPRSSSGRDRASSGRDRSSSSSGCNCCANGTSDVQRLELRHAAPEDDLGPSSHDLGRDLVGARSSSSSPDLRRSPTHLASSEGRCTGHSFPLKCRPTLTATSTAGGGWQPPYPTDAVDAKRTGLHATGAQHGACGARRPSSAHILTRARSCGGALRSSTSGNQCAQVISGHQVIRSSTSAVGYLVYGGGHRAEGVVGGAAGAGAGSAASNGSAASGGGTGGRLNAGANLGKDLGVNLGDAKPRSRAQSAQAAVGAARLVVLGTAPPPQSTSEVPRTAPLVPRTAPPPQSTSEVPRDSEPRTAPHVPRTAPPHAAPHRIVPYTGLVPRTAPHVPPAPPLHETTHVYLPPNPDVALRPPGAVPSTGGWGGGGGGGGGGRR